MELCISLYFLPGFLFCKLPKLGMVPTTMNRSVSGVSTSITLRTAAVICASPPSSICITQFTVHNNTTSNISYNVEKNTFKKNVATGSL